MIKDGEHLRLKLDNLEVEKNEHKFTIPLSDIATITLEGNKMAITTKLLAKFSEHNIALIICDSKYLPCGLFLGLGQYHHTAKRNLEQIAWDKNYKQEIWAEIVRQKIQNQTDVLKALQLEGERIENMQEFCGEILPADTTNREGHAAKVYFNTLYGMNFTRDVSCLENAAMNYGYTVIRAYIARIVTGLGLIPSLGIFHRNEYNSFNLVDDLIEPFRPLMDWYIGANILPKFEEYLSWDARCVLIDFLTQPYMHNGKRTTIDFVMLDYVNSFIRAMNEKDTAHLVEITLGGLRGV
jgi:CRISPR-associated protein Cas1